MEDNVRKAMIGNNGVTYSSHPSIKYKTNTRSFNNGTIVTVISDVFEINANEWAYEVEDANGNNTVIGEGGLIFDEALIKKVNAYEELVKFAKDIEECFTPPGIPNHGYIQQRLRQIKPLIDSL